MSVRLNANDPISDEAPEGEVSAPVVFPQLHGQSKELHVLQADHRSIYPRTLLRFSPPNHEAVALWLEDLARAVRASGERGAEARQGGTPHAAAIA